MEPVTVELGDPNPRAAWQAADLAGASHGPAIPYGLHVFCIPVSHPGLVLLRSTWGRRGQWLKTGVA
jgi:hypothetical protein